MARRSVSRALRASSWATLRGKPSSKTPAAVVTRLNAEIGTVLKMPEVKEMREKAGLDAESSAPEELSAVVRKDHARWGSVIKGSNITVE